MSTERIRKSANRRGRAAAPRGALLIHSHLLEVQLLPMARWNRDALLAPQICRCCQECKEATVPLEKAALRGRGPAFVFETQARFMI
jgi:hypothetical protein